MKGKVQTVLGLVEPEELGITLTHEHLHIDSSALGVPNEKIAHLPYTLENVGTIQQYPYSHIKNLKIISEQDQKHIMAEIEEYKKANGGCIVDNTSVGLTRNIKFLKDVSKKTGVHVVAGTGFYVDNSQTAEVKSLSEEKLSDYILKEICEGSFEDPSVKCGILGEIGTSYPITDFERRSLRASGVVSESTGCPAIIHPGRDHKAPAEAVRIFTESGGKADKLVMAHLDRTLHTKEDILEFAEFGTYLEYDLFGIEKSLYQQNRSVDMPSDAQRISRIKLLIENGYLEKIVIAHDIHTMHRLTAYGGHGFNHILNVVVPMMTDRGMDKSQIDQILIQNPANWLTFSK